MPVCVVGLDRFKRLGWLAVLLWLTGCSATYHFQYQYTLVSPPGGTEGIEDEQVRIQLAPEPKTGVIQLTLANKSPQPIRIIWEQTHFIDPAGRRRQATETGAGWFFRPGEWFANETQVATGGTLRLAVHPGPHQTYNPISISRAEGGGATLSTSATPLLPPTGTTATVGTRYQGREFQFILALQVGTQVLQYPFTFRITEVAVQP